MFPEPSDKPDLSLFESSTDYALRPTFLDLEEGMEPVSGYRLVGRLGEGGSGDVWKAMGPGGFAVALKFTGLDGGGETDQWRSLDLMRRVRHANLLTIFGAWQVAGYLVVGMELADRTLMDRFLESSRTGEPGIPPAELIEAMRQAAKGIDHLNQPRHALTGQDRAEILHGDIKPQNLLLVGDGVKVGDFGLARSLDVEADASGSTVSCMTLVYASPELIRGGASGRSDQYSLAVTYCQLRSGRLPFEGGPVSIMEGHLSRPPDLSMLPEAERAPVARALAKRPEDRWSDCGAFIAALAECSCREDRPPGPIPARAAPPARRAWPIWIPAAAVGLPALAALILLVADLLLTARPPADPLTAPAADHVLDSVPLLDRPDLAPRAEPARFETRVGSDIPAAGGVAPIDDGARRRAEALTTIRALGPPARRAFDRTLADLTRVRMPRPGTTEDWRVEPAAAGLAARERPEGPPSSGEGGPPNTPGPIAEMAGPSALGPGLKLEGRPLPSTATIAVLMPGAKAELAVKGEVGRGNPDEWYGPKRMIHTPPLSGPKDYMIGAFWMDKQGRPRTRSREGLIEPGHAYEVDLRADPPTWKEIERETFDRQP